MGGERWGCYFPTILRTILGSDTMNFRTILRKFVEEISFRKALSHNGLG